MSDRIYHTADDARCLELQQQIADEAARDELIDNCGTTQENDLTWLHLLPFEPDEDSLRRSAEYLHLRGLIEYDSTGKLVRFVEVTCTQSD